MTSFENLSSAQKIRAALHRDVRTIGTETCHFLGLEITKPAVEIVAELVFKKLAVYGGDLEAYAKHAKRSTINGEDVKLLVRRCPSLRTTINLWLRRNEETGGDLSAHHRQLYQRATTAEQDAAIVERHTSSPFLNTQITATQYSVSTQTIRRRLQAVGMKTRVPAKKIVFSAAHAEARVGFCLQYYNFDWENNVVIFVDEKTFKSDRDGRKILKRRHNTRYHVENVIPNRSSGRLSLGFWGWMSSVGPGELVEISGRMTSEQYVDILRDVMVPTVRLHHPTGTIYLCQDNSSIHSARVVQAWLQAQPDIQLMPWPAKSPDLNPIENLWGQMVLN